MLQLGAAVPILLHYSMASCWLVMCTLMVGSMSMVDVIFMILFLFNKDVEFLDVHMQIKIYVCYSVNYKYQVGVLGI